LTNPPFCGIIYTTKGQDPKTREVIIMDKTIGIVRRIDDLGRVVIPRELRKMLDIREGDPLNIQITDKEIIISKYQSTKLLDAAKNVVAVLASSGIGVTAYDVYEKKIVGDGDDVANLAEVQESKLVYTIGEDEEQCVYIVADALVVSFEARLVIEAVVEMANKAI
jgi:AbrB family looped-hinge helix DNA binding protein